MVQIKSLMSSKNLSPSNVIEHVTFSIQLDLRTELCVMMQERRRKKKFQEEKEESFMFSTKKTLSFLLGMFILLFTLHFL